MLASSAGAREAHSRVLWSAQERVRATAAPENSGVELRLNASLTGFFATKKISPTVDLVVLHSIRRSATGLLVPSERDNITSR
jgi:hypothetical protein